MKKSFLFCMMILFVMFCSFAFLTQEQKVSDTSSSLSIGVDIAQAPVLDLGSEAVIAKQYNSYTNQKNTVTNRLANKIYLIRSATPRLIYGIGLDAGTYIGDIVKGTPKQYCI